MSQTISIHIGQTGVNCGNNLWERICAEHGVDLDDNGKRTDDDARVLNFFDNLNDPNSCSIEPYNSIFTSQCLAEHTDMTIPIENEALYSICNQKMGINRPTYNDMNTVVSKVVSSFTLPRRSDDGKYSYYFDNPSPRLHFMISSYFPYHQNAQNEEILLSDYMTSLYDHSNMLAKCDTIYGRYTMSFTNIRSCSVVNLRVIGQTLNKLKSSQIIQFVWNWGGATCFISETPSLEDPLSSFMISNCTAIGEVFSKMRKKFDILFSKKAFVHYFTQCGTDLNEMKDAREDIFNLELDYEDKLRCNSF